MAEAYIVEAVRTAGGKKGGALKDWHPADMAAEVLDALIERSGIDPAAGLGGQEVRPRSGAGSSRRRTATVSPGW